MNSLTCYLRQGTTLEIADKLPKTGCQLHGLRNLIGGTITAGTLFPDVQLLPITDEQNGFVFDEAACRFDWYMKAPQLERNRRIRWRTALLLAQIAKILSGKKIMLMHGCLLKMDDGKGVLLCGQSGMGKSTTANRWKNSGGESPADDMLLLEYEEDILYAHPLPTWSRCIESTENEFFPIEHPLPLKTILALNRGDDTESIREVQGYQYMTALYASCALFTFQIVEKLPSKLQKQLISIVQNCANELYARFPYRTLFAHLQGNLRQTLSIFNEN